MDSNRNQTPQGQVGSGNIPLNYGELDYVNAYQAAGMQEGLDSSSTVNPPFPAPSENCDFPLGGYSDAWANYIGNFNFPVDPVDTSEQLTPAQLTELDEYINSLSQVDTSVSSASDTAAYATAQHPTERSDSVYADRNADFNREADAGRQLYADAYNQWNLASAAPENVQFSDGTYNPFGVQNDVFHSRLDHDIEPKNNEGNSCGSPHTESTVSPKPSFADVAKNKPIPGYIPVNPEPAPKINPRNCRTKSGKVSSTNSTKKDSPSLKPAGSNNHGPSNSAKSSTRKSKSCRPVDMQRSKSVPVEPSDINPDSRYGLDTFDYSSTWQSDRVAASCGSSRKNSTSSMSSGVSGLEDVHWGPARCGSDGGGRSCDPQATMTKQPPLSHSVNGGKDSKPLPNKQAAQQEKIHPQHGEKIFFDPRRIFQDSHEKSSKSDRKNNEDYVPNNKQKLQPEKEYILHKEKPKASVKCDSKFINNDLRDNKKHTNIEQERDHHQSSKDSKPKSTNSTGNQGRSRARVSNFEQTASSKSSTRGVRRYPSDPNNILGDFLMVSWVWLIWGCRELMHFLWSLLKLLLSVTILLLAVLAHYTIVFCCKLWSLAREKIPYFNKHRQDFDWSSGIPNSKQKQYGLKENIVLPTTGGEAMKRLQSCKGKDPYCILGVRADASDEDIKKYYRKQAMLVHPDKNQQPGAEEVFKILGHAFDLIGSVQKRLEYDAHEERKDAETAMHEFADLLTKLHEKLQEASNLLRCDHCGGKHRRVPTERPMYSARFCDRCNTRHPAKEGDVWAESKMLGFLWHYFACMEGKVYDITEWASCKRDNFKSMHANSHQVIYRLSTGAGKGKAKAGEPSLEDFLSTLFHQTGMAGEGGGGSGDYPSSSSKGNPGHQTQQSAKSKPGKKKKKKH